MGSMIRKRESTALGVEGAALETRWTLISVVQRAPDSKEAGEAMDRLCGSYWPSLFSFAKRQGIPSFEAKDMVQGFFEKVIRRHTFLKARRRFGRFRHYMMASFRNHLRDEHEKRSALKRGGREEVLSLQQTKLAGLLPSDDPSPELEHDRQVFHGFVDEAVRRLRILSAANGRRDEVFQALLPVINPAVQGDESYQELADRLNIPLNSVKSTVNRLRKQFFRLLKEVVVEAIEDPEELDEELRYYMRLFRDSAPSPLS